MLFGLVAVLATVLPIVTGGLEVDTWMRERHPQPWGQLQPQTPEWYEACSNAFKSFNPDTGMWKGKDGKYHYCRIVKK